MKAQNSSQKQACQSSSSIFHILKLSSIIDSIQIPTKIANYSPLYILKICQLISPFFFLLQYSTYEFYFHSHFSFHSSLPLNTYYKQPGKNLKLKMFSPTLGFHLLISINSSFYLLFISTIILFFLSIEIYSVAISSQAISNYSLLIC